MKINCNNYPNLIRYFVPFIDCIQLKDTKKISEHPMRIKDTKQEGFSISLHDIREQFNPYELDIVDYCNDCDDLYSGRLSIWKNININNHKLKDCNKNNNEYLIQFRTHDD